MTSESRSATGTPRSPVEHEFTSSAVVKGQATVATRSAQAMSSLTLGPAGQRQCPGLAGLYRRSTGLRNNRRWSPLG
jgi:hypothetical protein